MDNKQILAGGITAGVVIFLAGILGAGVVLKAEFGAIFEGVDLESQGVSIFILHTLTRLALGFAAYTVFALSRKLWQRNRALFASLALVWVLLYLPALGLFHDLGFLGLSGILKVGAFGIAEIAIAILAGDLVAKRFKPQP